MPFAILAIVILAVLMTLAIRILKPKRRLAWLALLLITFIPAMGATRYTQRLIKAVQAIINTLTVETSATLAAATVTGNLTATGGVTLQNSETVTNGTDNTAAVNFGGAGANTGIFELNSQSASSADNDATYLDFANYNDNATPGKIVFSRLTSQVTDITSTTYDSLFKIGVQTAGSTTPTDELIVSGAAVYPNADAGLNLGIASTNQFGSAYLDTLYLGDAGGKKVTFYSGSIAAGAGATAVDITCAGVDADDVVVSAVQTAGADKAIVMAAPGSGKVSVTLADNSTATSTVKIMMLED